MDKRVSAFAESRLGALDHDLVLIEAHQGQRRAYKVPNNEGQV